ncbi:MULTISPECIES: thiamine pyrophosphate-binding protein [unclassified Streptomyces]|uniref:thiamine pyrophosphate-binding protein n=1 Tax=unclassified Streptomyces TaxID=2593676 RepID=UPI002E8106F3|nr:thiamine pyrophosphate-binding protein [Streptomyces sp. NBC_00589]WTI34510.1 thiamine pyrophosphate-binding protein [Streptomyces sp. NBC_00775]WUB31818.1 thiamine pyrophosphate-binding protein [Streptomyces sp. NBC_00589]
MGRRPALALLDILRGEGVDRVFGNPGTTELPFLAALVDAEDAPEYVLGIHEGAVVSMADGYARATGRPAFVSLHIAAGLANGLIGLLNARRSRTPLVVMAGQQDRRHLQQDPMLSGDLLGLARPAVKAAVDVQHARDLPLAVRRAFALAVRPPAGPVFLSVPMDLLTEDTEVEVPPPTPTPRTGPAVGLERAAFLLGGAARPVIVAGDGVGRDNAVPALARVAEACGAPVHHQPMADCLNFPTTHPLYAGMLPPRHDAIRTALAPYDTVLIAGAHAFTPHHYSPGPALPPGLTVVQLDSDPDEIGRNFPADTGLVGALAPSLDRLAELLRERVPAHTAKARVLRAGERHTAERGRTEAAARAAYSAAPLAPWAAAHAVARGLPRNAAVVEEAITVGLLLRRLVHLDRPGSYTHTVGGGLGWGIGAAVGRALAEPGRPVVAVLGDGCALFGLQGLWSAARCAVPVLFAVMSNGAYRTLQDTYEAMGGHGPCPGTELGALDFTQAARFFGIDAVRAGSADHVRELVSGAAELTRPLLLDIPLRQR